MKGDMWDVFGKTGWFLVTTNPVVTKLGKCVMGRGIAKDMADRYPEVPFVLGTIIQKHINSSDWRNVGSIGVIDGQAIGYFMVKDHWMEPAKKDIIQTSVAHLCEYMDFVSKFRVDLNFPGIGNGKLRREDVLPLLEPLPDNVHIWEYE